MQYQKFGHHKEICRGCQVLGKCGEHYPDHRENECKNIKCTICHGLHPAFSICGIYKKEKEIMFVKHTKIYRSLKPGKLSKAMSVCRAGSTDIPDPLSPLFPIVHHVG